MEYSILIVTLGKDDVVEKASKEIEKGLIYFSSQVPVDLEEYPKWLGFWDKKIETFENPSDLSVLRFFFDAKESQEIKIRRDKFQQSELNFNSRNVWRSGLKKVSDYLNKKNITEIKNGYFDEKEKEILKSFIQFNCKEEQREIEMIQEQKKIAYDHDKKSKLIGGKSIRELDEKDRVKFRVCVIPYRDVLEKRSEKLKYDMAMFVGHFEFFSKEEAYVHENNPLEMRKFVCTKKVKNFVTNVKNKIQTDVVFLSNCYAEQIFKFTYLDIPFVFTGQANNTIDVIRHLSFAFAVTYFSMKKNNLFAKKLFKKGDGDFGMKEVLNGYQKYIRKVSEKILKENLDYRVHYTQRGEPPYFVDLSYKETKDYVV